MNPDEFEDEGSDDTESTTQNDIVVDEESVLLTYLFANHGLFAKANPILKPEYFNGKYADALRFVQEQYAKHHQIPNRLLIASATGFVADIVTDQNDPFVQTLIEESTESFCRKQAGNKFLIKAVDMLAKDRSNNTMAELREEMNHIGNISMQRDLGSEFHEDHERMLKSARETTNISTGSFYLDIVLGGGLTRPSMNIYSAATGDGKSIFLANRAIDYIRTFPGEDVVYYTLENSEELTYQRLAAMMAEIDIKVVLDNVDKVSDYVYKNKNKEGRLFIKRMGFRGTTMSDIQAHFYDLRTSKSPNLRCGVLDYMELLSPTAKVPLDNLHVRDQQVASETYDFVHREKLIWWTAAQQTKGADEETEAKKGKVAGGVGKIYATDNLFIGKRNDEDILNSRIWFHCKKARSSGGINAAIPTYWNRKTQRMKDWRGINGDEINGSDEEFRRANPRLFGVAPPRNRVEADPVAAEQGVTATPPAPPGKDTDKTLNMVINKLRFRDRRTSES